MAVILVMHFRVLCHCIELPLMTRCLLVSDIKMSRVSSLFSTHYHTITERFIKDIFICYYHLSPLSSLQFITPPLSYSYLCLLQDGRKQGHSGGGDQLQASGDLPEDVAGKRREEEFDRN